MHGRAAAILSGMKASPARTPAPTAVPAGADDTDERLYVASVEKAMRVLSSFGPERPWMSLAEIAVASGIGRSAAQRFACTLLRLGYLQRDPVTRQYGLAVRLLSLVRGMLAGHAMLERGQPVLAELACATGETVSWVELDGDWPTPGGRERQLPGREAFGAKARSSACFRQHRTAALGRFRVYQSVSAAAGPLERQLHGRLIAASSGSPRP